MAQRRTDDSTVGLSRVQPIGEEAERPALPGLTLLFHPALERIGQRAVLGELARGREALVGRLCPDFSFPGQGAGEPLDDSHISRQPLRLRPLAEGDVELRIGTSRTTVMVAGTAVSATRVFSAAELAAGVVLELADRVVLLLHLVHDLPSEPGVVGGLVGDSDAARFLRGEIRRIADLDVPVLLRGETGTGKELLARAVHETGPRREGPFVAVNLAAIPPSLVASELFGAVKGAFTGSVANQEGYFRRAHGGTLFLDEVGEAPAEVQVLLLRALETGEVAPLGSQAPRRVDVRIVAATDADLEKRVATGEFRAPLLHRLASYEILLPPLRERRDDVGRILLHFLRQELAAIGESRRLAAADATTWLPPRLVADLVRYDWPGNVRQLKNVVRQLVIGSRDQPRLALSPAMARLLTPGSEARRTWGFEGAAAARQPAPRAFRRPTEISEEELLAALASCRFNLRATAQVLGVSRTSLYARVEASPRVRKAGDLSVAEITRCHAESGGDLDTMVAQLQVSPRALWRRLREMGLA